MFGNFFKFRPKKFLGIDIGTSFIKAVELRRSGSRAKLENYGEAGILYPERPFRMVEENTLLLSDQDIAVAIRNICQEAGIRTRDVNFAIPDFSSFFTTFKLPAMTKEEIPEAVQYEIRPYIPLPLYEITLDWVIIEGDVGKTPLKVLAVAIPNDIIKQYQQIAFTSKLNLKSLEPEVFSLARALNFLLRGGDKKQVAALLDIGARSTTCSVLEDGVLRISHSFSIGSNQITETLARSLNIDYNKAEELKKKQGLVLPSGQILGGQEIRKILLPLVDEIINETKKTFRDFFQAEGKEITKVLLAGGSSLLPGLKEYFYTELEKEVIIANAFLNISYPQILTETLNQVGPSYGVAAGLALKGLE